MGELSTSDANAKRSKYVSHLKKLVKAINEDYSEMDFENAKQKDGLSGSDIKSKVDNITSELNSIISSLQGMSF